MVVICCDDTLEDDEEKSVTIGDVTNALEGDDKDKVSDEETDAITEELGEIVGLEETEPVNEVEVLKDKVEEDKTSETEVTESVDEIEVCEEKELEDGVEDENAMELEEEEINDTGVPIEVETAVASEDTYDSEDGFVVVGVVEVVEYEDSADEDCSEELTLEEEEVEVLLLKEDLETGVKLEEEEVEVLLLEKALTEEEVDGVVDEELLLEKLELNEVVVVVEEEEEVSMLLEEVVIEVVVKVGVTDEVEEVVGVLVVASQSLQLIPSTTMPAEDK